MEEDEVDAACRGIKKRTRTEKSESEDENLASMKEMLKKMSDQMAKREEEMTREMAKRDEEMAREMAKRDEETAKKDKEIERQRDEMAKIKGNKGKILSEEGKRKKETMIFGRMGSVRRSPVSGRDLTKTDLPGETILQRSSSLMVRTMDKLTRVSNNLVKLMSDHTNTKVEIKNEVKNLKIVTKDMKSNLRQVALGSIEKRNRIVEHTGEEETTKETAGVSTQVGFEEFFPEKLSEEEIEMIATVLNSGERGFKK
ncbi:uncharacterized protein LOC126893031 [Diabrotica virgifera virgifera]|uniref:Uncharacterized protein n=1 Tax=Diabrotica virgifera virgifera TaxID=50390 RepID=A0ABM5L913_DIAVI|nr:uncharacterized protein LOC126893031 [Diabrotica virgifera virgifera]